LVEIKHVTEISELEGIRLLQEQNLKKNLTKEEYESEGFVSAVYTLDFLKQMHADSPSVIAKDGDRVVGYAIVTLRSAGEHHELLADLFNTINRTVYNGHLLHDARYVAVGQLCVGKGYRGMGLVQRMYGFFRDGLIDQFDYCITDVARDNPRSLKAHQKRGFKVINSLTYGGIAWDIVLWDWTLHQ